jgi:type I restriction enzyme S subunit
MAGEWETVELGEVAAVRSGYAFKSSDWKDSGIPVVKIANVKGGRLEMTGCSFVAESTAAESGEFQLTTGDILIAMTGYIGDVARVRKTDLPCVLNQRVGKFSVRDKKRLDADFLYTFLAWAETRQTIEALGYGSAQPNVSPSLIHKVELPLPPLAEQKAIAVVLGALDDKIELNRRMNATLEAMARALFQSWFVDFDPVRRNLDRAATAQRKLPTLGKNPAATFQSLELDALFPAAFQESPLGHIPMGWDAIPLYDTAQWVNGAAFKNEDFCAAGEGLPVIKIAELKDGIGTQTKWCQRDAGADKIIDTGDLVYSWSGSPDTSLEAFLWSGGRGLLNQHIFKVISATAAEKRFVYYLLQYLRPVLVETARNKQTTGLGHVTIAT